MGFQHVMGVPSSSIFVIPTNKCWSMVTSLNFVHGCSTANGTQGRSSGSNSMALVTMTTCKENAETWIEHLIELWLLEPLKKTANDTNESWFCSGKRSEALEKTMPLGAVPFPAS